MTQLSLMKTASGYVPATDQDADIVVKHRYGDIIQADFKKMRNPKFHRKFFALLNIGFNEWEPGELSNKYGVVEKNFEQFRKDITILAGYYEQHFRVDGSVRIEAKSISFANMDENEFNQLYSSVINVLLSRVFASTWNREQIDRVVDQIIGFV